MTITRAAVLIAPWIAVSITAIYAPAAADDVAGLALIATFLLLL